MYRTSQSRFSLDRRVALVTGSTTGLGKAMAMALAEAGAAVAMNYARDQGRAERALTEFRERGYNGILVRANVIDPAEAQELYERIQAVTKREAEEVNAPSALPHA